MSPPSTPLTGNKQPAPKPPPGFGSGAPQAPKPGKSALGTRLVKGTPALPLPSFLPFNFVFAISQFSGPDGISEPGIGYKTPSQFSLQIQLRCIHFKYKFSASLYVTKSHDISNSFVTLIHLIVL